ncbi:MAG TPA: alkaline phosphatase family protein [Candidatus Dormibacteraeota bacterium]|nr:alkaline phosphatase family protein [Candidatus Dormibacteraeota bacterium]
MAEPSPSASPRPSPKADPPHVFVIVLENRSYAEAITTPYLADLASRYGLATNYHGVAHPSLPNYLALTSGSTWGVADDGWHALPAGGLGAQLDAAGLSWRAYMEGMAAGCYRNVNRYALKHNPFAYYGADCPSQVVPFSEFASDMSAGDAPQFVWITPDLCHDGHDCSNGVVSDWLSQTVPVILNSEAWKNDGVLFITYDEGEDSANSVLTLVIRDRQVSLRSSVEYDHYSLLASIEDLLGLPRLAQAANAAPMTDLLATRPVKTPPRRFPSTS